MFIRLPSPLYAPEGPPTPSPTPAPAVTPSPTPAPAVTPSPAPIAFADTLPEDIRTDAAFRDIKDLGGLAKSYLNAHKMIGADKNTLIAVPREDTPEAWAEVYTKLGRPETADKYELKAPDGVTVDKDLETWFRGVAHESGLNGRQVTNLFSKWNEMVGAKGAAMTRDAEAAKTAAAQGLKTEWGVAFDDKMGDAVAALNHYSGELKLGDGVFKELDASGLGNNPGLAKLLAHIGGQLREDGTLQGRAGADAVTRSPTEAKQEISALQADPIFMKQYMNKRDPGHQAALTKMQQAYAMAFPEQAAS